jgi:phosphoribosylformylglycinamidine (FGAM) synthase-like enzyme
LGVDVDFDGVEAAVSGATNERVWTRATTPQFLFNESQSRIVISVIADDAEKTMSILRERGVPSRQLGKVGGDELRIAINEETFRWPIVDLYDDWFNAIRRTVEGETERIPSL